MSDKSGFPSSRIVQMKVLFYRQLSVKCRNNNDNITKYLIENDYPGNWSPEKDVL